MDRFNNDCGGKWILARGEKKKKKKKKKGSPPNGSHRSLALE